MKNIFKKSLATSLSIVGAMIGVGLASGKEVVSFFARYGFWSLAFCFVSGVGFFALIYVSLKINSNCKNTHKNKNRKSEINNVKYERTTQVGRKKHVSNYLYNIILYICQISICSAMFAGIGSILETFRMPFILKFLLLIVLYFVSILILNSGNRVVYSFNALLSVALILFVFVILVVGLCFGKVCNVVGCSFSNVLCLKCFLYAGMNVLTVYPILKDSANFVENKKEIFLISLISSILISVVLFIVCLCVLLFSGMNIYDDMVMLAISKKFNDVLFVVHFCLICISIFSTLLSTAYGASKCFGKYNLNNMVNLTISFALSFVGFSNLIDFMYPLLGIIFIIYIAFAMIFEHYKNRKIAMYKT